MLSRSLPLRRRGVRASASPSRLCLTVIIAAMACLMVAARAQATAPFPITETFTHATVGSGWNLGGSASLTAPSLDADGSGWLRLTGATNNQAGYAFFDQSFPNTQGFVATFDYAVYGGPTDPKR